MASAKQDIKALVGLITTSVDNLTATHERSGRALPSLDDASPFSASTDLDIEKDIAVLTAACDQLKATFALPAKELNAVAFSAYLPSALRVAIEAHVAETLKDAPAEGVHIEDIAKPTGVDPDALARCLRLLADYHIFREVSYLRFAHTRLSVALDTGKPIEAISKTRSGEWYAGTNGITAALHHLSEEGTRCAARLPDWLSSRQTNQSNAFARADLDHAQNGKGAAPTTTDYAFQLAYGTAEKHFSWVYGRPHRLARFQAALDGFSVFHPPSKNAIPGGSEIPWKDLPNGSLVVDVGGGRGATMHPLAIKYPHLRFVVQELPGVEAQFDAFWAQTDPQLVESGRVGFQAHDMFTPNPIRGAALYYLQTVMHDWSDEDAIKILKSVVAAASTSSYILLVDALAPTAPPLSSSDPSAQSRHTDIQSSQPLPAPLVAPASAYGGAAHRLDLHMLSLLQGKERTAENWRRLADAVGLRIVQVVPPDYVAGPGKAFFLCVKE